MAVHCQILFPALRAAVYMTTPFVGIFWTSFDERRGIRLPWSISSRSRQLVEAKKIIKGITGRQTRADS